MMETIKVNMNPNPLDVQTIHASQNDGEARQWGFELHNNGELFDTSDVKEQMFFKAYKGGTEQILPENTSTPTTSPFLGDIQYPDATRTGQEFLYRQSPTEEDGNAKIKNLYGNTLVWNQLVQNGNFLNTNNWNGSTTSFTVSNNKATIVCGQWRGINQVVTCVPNHKYLLMATCKSSTTGAFMIMRKRKQDTTQYVDANVPITQTQSTLSVVSTTESDANTIQIIFQNNTADEKTIEISNVMLIDLTLLNASVIQDYNSFKSYFPLPYYSYQSTLLPFKGTGIKTTGKNLLENKGVASVNLSGVITTKNDDGSITVNGTANGNNVYSFNSTQANAFDFVLPSGNYKMVFVNGGANDGQVGIQRNGVNSYVYTDANGVANFTVQNGDLMRIAFYVTSGKTYNTTLKAMICSADADNTYEPYTSSTLSLPISTYFPTGMKSAGNVYDELTESKASTRIGAVDLGSLTYTYDGECFIGKIPSDAKVLSTNTETLNSITPLYQINNWTAVKFYKANMTLGTGVSRYICIFNTSYTDPTAFKTAMVGQYLYYELATPTETSFTTASLVTENAEIPLSNEDGTLIGKCTEELSSQPGFFDAKIKLTDGGGTCYSNKIQLHVERKP